MKKKFYAILLIIPIAMMLFQMNTSCNGPQPSKCVITVMDSAGTRARAGVKVHMYANVTYNGGTYSSDLKADGVTGSDGKVAFSFKNPCVMDILATVSNCTVSGPNHVYCTASGIVKCEEGKTAEKTVRVDH